MYTYQESINLNSDCVPASLMSARSHSGDWLGSQENADVLSTFCRPSNAAESIKCLWPPGHIQAWIHSRRHVNPPPPPNPHTSLPHYRFSSSSAFMWLRCLNKRRPWPLPFLKVHTNVKPMTSCLLMVAACLKRSTKKRGQGFDHEMVTKNQHFEILLVRHRRDRNVLWPRCDTPVKPITNPLIVKGDETKHTNSAWNPTLTALPSRR